MKISITESDSSRTLVLTGCLDTAAADEFFSTMEGVLASNPAAKSLAIDFTAVDFISSSGLRVLVHAAKLESRSQRKITLLGLNDVIKEVLEVTGLKSVFIIPE